MPRLLWTQRRATVLVVELHELFEHAHKGQPLTGLERRQDEPLRRFDPRLDVFEETAPDGSDEE